MTDTWISQVSQLLAGRGGALLAATVAVAAVTVLVARRVRPDRLLAWAAAAIATGVSGTGMWQVADKALHLNGPLRAVLFGFAEIALLSSAIRARRHHHTHGRGGPDAAGVWVIATAAGAVSAMESTSLPEAAVRLAAPLLAAWLWHRGLDESGGATTAETVTMRLSIRRLLVALRLADPGTIGLAQLARARQLDAVVLAAVRVDSARGNRGRRRAAHRLDRAGRNARGVLDPAGVAYVRTTLAAIYGLHLGVSRGAVADLHPWTSTPIAALLDRPELEPAPDGDDADTGTPGADPWQYAEPVSVAVYPDRTGELTPTDLGSDPAVDPDRTTDPTSAHQTDPVQTRQPKSVPDVTDLLPVAREVAGQLAANGLKLSRAALAPALRQRGVPISTTAAGALVKAIRSNTDPVRPVNRVPVPPPNGTTA